VVKVTATRHKQNSNFRHNLRWSRPPIKNTPAHSIPAPAGQPSFPGIFRAAVVPVCAVAWIVSIAVACPFTVCVAGLTLHVIWLDDGAHVRVTATPCVLVEARLSPTDPDAPPVTEISGACAAIVKSPIAVWLAVIFATLLVDGR